jgi:hypothetical protein
MSMLPPSSGRGLLVVTPYIVVIGYQRFRGPCCLHSENDLDLKASKLEKVI